MKLWDISIRQPVLTTMAMVALVVLGIVSFLRMPVDLFPDVSFPVVAVTTVYPGAGPEEVEDQVTSLMEEELSSITGVDSISSDSGEGFSVVVLQFTMETSTDQAGQDVRERLNQVSNQLPTDALTPIVQRFDPSSQPIMIFAVADTSGEYSQVELRKKVELEIQQPLQRIPGVAVVEVNGGQVREIQVNLDMLALQGKFIAPQQVSGAIQASNMNIPGGSVPDGDLNVQVRTPGNINTLEDLGNVVISQRGAPVRVRDVGEIVDGFEERSSYTRINREDAIVVNVRKQSGTNTSLVADDVNAALERIGAASPELDIAVVADESIFVRESTGDAINDTIWGGLLASLVVLLFFRNFRNTFLTMIGLPIIMIGTLWGMDSLGISLNLVSLLALALVVGLVIDDAIVVRENIFRWIAMGYSPKEASSKATAEVALPVLATSATLLAVFLPVAYATGIVGQFFRDFGLTVAVAIVISTFEALTLAPMVSAYFFDPGRKERKRRRKQEKAEESAPEVGETDAEAEEMGGEEKTGTGWMYRVYGRLLNWTLDHKRLALVVTTVVMALSLYSFTLADQTFLASIDEGEFSAELTLEPGTRLELTDEAAVEIEQALLAHPHVDQVFTTIGGQGTPEKARFVVQVDEDANVPTRAVMDEVRAELNDVPGLAFQLSAGAFDFGFGGLQGRDIVVEVRSESDTQADLAAGTQIVMDQLAALPGLIDVESNLSAGKPEMRIDVESERASQFGLSSVVVGATIRTLLTGDVASTFRGEGAEGDIRVQLRPEDRGDLEDILNYKLLSQTGQLVPLRNVATVSLATGPSTISRVNRQPTVTIGANFSGRSENEVLPEVNNVLATVQLPPGINAVLSGQAAEQAESFADLYQALALAIIFVYMVLASQFGSFTQPVLIMIALPLSVIGAILALVLTGNPLDMTAMIGFIMLMGLATKNSILLVDFANQERKRGASADAAMRAAGPVRLRPILMTAISLILGMVPVALGLGPGGDFRAPMAIAIIGGMTTSTFLTLFIVPLAYAIWVGFQDRWEKRRAERKAGKERQSVPRVQPAQ